MVFRVEAGAHNLNSDVLADFLKDRGEEKCDDSDECGQNTNSNVYHCARDVVKGTCMHGTVGVM